MQPPPACGKSGHAMESCREAIDRHGQLLRGLHRLLVLMMAGARGPYDKSPAAAARAAGSARGLRQRFERIFDVAHAVADLELGFHLVGDEAELPVVVTHGDFPDAARDRFALHALRAARAYA